MHPRSLLAHGKTFSFRTVRKDEVVKGGRIVTPVRSLISVGTSRMEEIQGEKRKRAKFEELHDGSFKDPFEVNTVESVSFLKAKTPETLTLVSSEKVEGKDEVLTGAQGVV